MPPDTRTTLHLVAAHVLGRRRFAVSGRFGLRATPRGFGTPAFGEGPEVVRVSGTTLVREVGATRTRLPIPGASLRRLASFVEADIDAEFSAGADTPPVGDPDAGLELDTAETTVIAEWYRLGWEVLDSFLDTLGPEAEPATVQLWPEHFDAATAVAVAGGDHLNLGFSPGDAHEPDRYLYVGPWGEARRGDPAFWNAPFGAVLRAGEVTSAPEPAQRCREFLAAGLRNAAGA